VAEQADPDGQPKHDPLAPFREVNYRYYAFGRFAASTGMTLFQAALLWHLYELTDSALSLGLLGLVRVIPALATSFIGGVAADLHNRRHIVIAAQAVEIGISVLLAVATFGGWVSPGLIYGLVVVLALVSAFEYPAAIAMLPGLVKPEVYSHAVTVNSSLGSLGRMAGPAIGGLVIGFAGIGDAYLVHSVMIGLSLFSALLISYQWMASARRFPINVQTLTEGVRFVRNRQVLLGAMSLDLFAVLFGGAQALLPVYAKDILGVGAQGYGLLSASIECGAFLMAFILMMRPPVNRTGLTLIMSVAMFGLLTILFGLTRSLPLSMLLYAMIGMADQASMVMRHTTIQMATPDELRGRVTSVHQVFVGSSNQVNAIYSGFVATITSAAFAIVSGGIGTLLVVAFVALRMPAVRNYRVREFAAESREAHRAAGGQPVAVTAPAQAADDG
jgi:MFS family permease